MSVIRSAKAVSDPGAAAATRPTGMPFRLAVIDEIPNDQKISGKAHRLYDGELVLESLPIGALVNMSPAARHLGDSTPQKAITRALCEITVKVVPLWNGVLRQKKSTARGRAPRCTSWQSPPLLRIAWGKL